MITLHKIKNHLINQKLSVIIKNISFFSFSTSILTIINICLTFFNTKILLLVLGMMISIFSHAQIIRVPDHTTYPSTSTTHTFSKNIENIKYDTSIISGFITHYHIKTNDFLLESLDTLISNAIEKKAFPGCVIYASQYGIPFFFKAYGYHTYDSLMPVKKNHIYDLASITKVTGSTLALMKLYEKNLITLDMKLGDIVKGLGKKISQLTLREILAHQSGLYPWIPFYKEIKNKKGEYKKNTIYEKPTQNYTFEIAQNRYLHKDFYKKIKRMIRKSEVSSNKTYVYSGLFFYLVPELVQKLTNMDLEAFLNRYFYKPLNATTIVYTPLELFDKSMIVPTEKDAFFRMNQIHGTVHDEGAIMMKGVSGNAGLFSNAEDLAKVWHMLLNGGKMNEIQYLKPNTIQLFTTAQFPNNKNNRRGIGFDKPLLEYEATKSSVAQSSSLKSYGHSGYTGTIVWADPEKQLLFIFLSNRVYPTRKNTNLYRLNIRPRIHQIMYDYVESIK